MTEYDLGVSFTVTGSLDGERETLAWSLDRGFDDSMAGLAARALVAAGEEVYATVTGPFFTAASVPAEDAFVTALNVFGDNRETVEVGGDDGERLLRWLDEVTRVPDGASA